MIDAVLEYAQQSGRSFRIGLIYDKKTIIPSGTKRILDDIDVVIACDTMSLISLQTALLPYQNQLLAITCRGEDQIPLLTRVIPHVPYLPAPTTESLQWSSDKLLMRRRLFYHDKKITPKYSIAKDATQKTITKIEKKLHYPMIVKPTGLAASRLVTICYHKDELDKTLKKVFRSMKRVHKDTGGNWEPKVVVEEFLEGEMYSIDAYVGSRGKVHFCPLVHVKTGRLIGFDDFFGYQQITPTNLNTTSKEAAIEVAKEAICALGLRSTTAHVELMKTEKGWKIIELGSRVGGFRHMMYEFSYGINHTMNDILIRMNEKPIIPKKIKGYTAAMKFFAKQEGNLTKLRGVKKAQVLSSFKKIYINKKVGDRCTFAKNGGSSIFNIILFNTSRSALLADIRRLENMIEIQTQKK